MKEEFDNYITSDKIVFSVDIKQAKNKKDEWKKKVFFPKNWETFTLDDTLYDEKKNSIAMLTGKINNIFVIDVDNLQHWKNFLKENNEKEPKTVKAISASGGIHLYFKYSKELDIIKTGTRSFGKEYDIDIRTNGGCIFVPPTSYYDNKTKKQISYKWVTSLLEEEPIDLPKWILSKLTKDNLCENITKTSRKSIKMQKDIVIKSKKTKDTTKGKIDLSDEDENLSENDRESEDASIDYDNEEITKMLDLLSAKRVEDYNDWITAGMAIYNSSSGRSFSVWDDWSKKSKKYDSNLCKQKWKSFKTKLTDNKPDNQVTLGTIVYWCKQDSPEQYKEFKIKRKTDQMILEKYPNLELDLGKTIEVSGRKCTFLNNDNCVFIGKPHKGHQKTMFVEVHNGVMELRCRHEDCTGKAFPCPPIKLTKNEMNLLNYGTINVTINNNYGSADEQLIEFQKYDIFENETVNELVYNSLNGAHTSMADLIYYYYKNEHTVGEDNNWYSYEDHKWNFIGAQNEYFAKDIEKKLISIYDQLIDYGKGIKMDSIKIKEFEKIIRSFKNVQTKSCIMTATKELFKVNNNPKRNFVKNLNKNKHLIVFKNGVYDLKKYIFRDGVPSDNVTISIDYDYIPRHSKKYGELLKFLKDIQPNEEEREFLLTYLSHALYENMLEWFTILTGEGRNGKSKLIELIKKTFSNYYGSVKSQMFTRPQPDASSPDPGLLDLHHKKIVIASEPEKKAKLNSGFIKFITGRDSVRLRECHKNEMHDFEPKFITLFVCNDIPETDEIDSAFSKRLRCVNFPTEFCDNPINPNQKKMDTKINEKFDDWRADFMLLLIEHFKKYMETQEIQVTKNILKWTDQYKEETDIYLIFFNECTEEAETHISKSSIYEAFKTWFVANNPKTRIPSNREFATSIKKHKVIKKVRIGGSVVYGIENLRILDD